MKKEFLDFINKLEGFKTSIKSLHWDAINLSQHRLCDDIAGDISDIQDTISEIEQSMDGNLSLNKLVPVEYHIKDLNKFINDVIKDTTSFYNDAALKGDDYIGMRSEIESFLAKMQKYIYLNDFCLHEDKKRAIANKLNESKKQLHEITSKDLENMVIEAVNRILMEKSNGTIDINPENKGKFTATKKATGKTTEELTHSKNPLTRKRAIFVQNAKKWNH